MTSSKKLIRDYKFNDETPKVLLQDNFYTGWPVVYIINNDKEMYIGETYHAPERMKQHLEKQERRKLEDLHIIGSSDFTKSATLDIESSLIELCKLENKRQLQNANDGLVNHNYANKDHFRKDSDFFYKIWKELYDRGLVEKDIENLLNSDLFKYSPYKSLNAEQCSTRDYILQEIEECLKDNKERSIFVNGSAGTGKTILAIYLLKLLMIDTSFLSDSEDINNEVLPFVKTLNEIKRIKPNLKVAYVVAMTSLRKTLKEVFGQIKGLKKNMVIAPGDVFKDDYDILIVDEAHRLKQRKNIMEYEVFDTNNRSLGLDNNGTQLDWIIRKSKIQILFYDHEQSIKPTDVDESRFKQLLSKDGNSKYELSSQMRCIAGSDYIKYIKNILNERQSCFVDFSEKYEFKIFKDIEEFRKIILEKENQDGLSRIVSGYGFEWKNKTIIKNVLKNKIPNVPDLRESKDVVIGSTSMYWNCKADGWPVSLKGKQVIEEVGCIHTIQGYDLNYCGVIFGPEIVYRNNAIEIIRENYFDENGKKGTTDLELKEYIINIYAVLLTRGIKGTYVYVCDEELRKYLEKYINN